MTNQSADATRTRQLSQAKRALLERRLRGNLQSVVQPETIPARDPAAPVPLSHAQERMWFISQLDPDTPAYNMYNVVRLRGALDVARLTASFRLLVERHESLRTHFVATNGQPYQQIVPVVPVEIAIRDQQSPVDPQQDGALNALIRAEIRRPFDLACCPLWRIVLFRLAQDHHILVLTIHHAIFDEWSNDILWQELSTAYRGLGDGRSPELADLPVQYADFTFWQRDQANEQLPAQMAYWKQQLGHDLPILRLGEKGPRPSQPTFDGAIKWVDLPASLCSRLRALNSRFGTTMFMVNLAAFQILLHRYTEQGEILVGAPIAVRTHPEVKGLIGLFLNTLVMRAEFADDPRFDDFLQQVRRTALGGYAHRDLPFEMIVDQVQPRRVAGQNPIFQVMFVHQKRALDKIDLPGLTASQVPVDTGVAKFDLTLFVEEGEQDLRIGLEYNSSIYDVATAERLLGHYQRLLESILEDPRQRISDLQLLTDGERATILHQWNRPSLGSGAVRCIHDLFQERVASTPEATALVEEGRRLSYRDLDRRANQLAHYLHRVGVKPNVPVGLMLDRSVEMVVAMLGVLKAGGAYVPLDPAYPAERLSFMLADTQAPLLLTQQKYADSLPETAVQMVLIDAAWPTIGGERDDTPTPSAQADDLAYIIYTSGSTGTPKGVPISHRNLVHSTSARFDYYEEPVDRFLLLSSYSFDSSIVGLFWPLCQGGTLVLPPPGIELEMRQLAATIAAHQISHVLMLPSLYALFLKQADPDQLASLRAVIVAGEACDRALVMDHYATAPHAGLFNEYGPTEGTVWSTVYQVPADFSGQRVPIGRPIANVTNYILDRGGQLAPVGVPGELYIGGAGVTAGYWRRPELTEAAFVPDRFGGDDSARLYRTGDLCRYRPDGVIEFLGRVDHQIKIRGFRVEPGEIEQKLKQHPAVQDAVVVPHNFDAAADPAHDPTGGQRMADARLVAYVVCVAQDESTVAQLRAFVRQELPDYMMPATFVLLETLPLTPNGKVDRNALPAPQAPAARPNEQRAEATDDLERQLVGIWEALLQVSPIGVTDDFFELGGHSLLSIRLIAQIEDQFGIRLPVASLFDEPTVRHMAALLRQALQPDHARALEADLDPRPSQPSQAERAVVATKPPKSYSMRRRLWGRALFTGPRVGGAALPYAVGVTAQRRWLRFPAIRRELSVQTAYLEAWYAALGEAAPPEEKVEQFLLANTWRHWRDACLSKPDIYQKWVELRGIEPVRECVRRSQAKVFVWPHVGFGPRAAHMAVQAVTGAPAFVVGKTLGGVVESLVQLEQAIDVLKAAGNVIIAGDGNQGVDGVTISLAGHSWMFRYGAAELALQTGAALIPIFPQLQNDGRILVEFTEPLRLNGEASDSAVEALTRQYALLYAQRWSEMLPNMKWHNLKEMLEWRAPTS